MDAARGYNVIGAFGDSQRARRAISDLSRRGIPEQRVRLLRKGQGDVTRVAEMQAEMAEEVTHGWAGPSVGFMTPSQAKGALFGTVTGAVIGLAIGLAVGAAWGLFTDSPISSLGRLAIGAACFLVGGATMGVIAGGALKPRIDGAEHPGRMLDERRLAGESDTLVAVHVDGDREAEVAQDVLTSAGAERVDAIVDDGSPMAPQHEHPRPADPPDWWKEEGSGRG